MRLLGDVRSEEVRTTLLFTLNLFVLLVSYYVMKTVREGLVIATGGAQLKGIATLVQAILLVVLVPLYGRLARGGNATRLIRATQLFFLVSLQLFFFAALFQVPLTGFVFYVWVGIFNVAAVAQCWSLANDVFSHGAGHRTFPIINLGANLGAFLGAQIGGLEVLSTPWLVQLAAVGLVVHALLYRAILAKHPIARADESLAGTQTFTLVLRSPYLRLVALLVVLLNLVNTTGELILAKLVETDAHNAYAVAVAAGSSLEVGSFVGDHVRGFYGGFYSWVSLASIAIQALLVSRVVRYLGLGGALLALPVIAFGTYGLVAVGASFSLFKLAKMAENAVDYSVMNTSRALLWLPTSRRAKYKGKQVVDTFFVRFGDILAAAFVTAGTEWFVLSVAEFAVANLVFVGAWLVVVLLIVREHRALVRVRSKADGGTDSLGRSDGLIPA